MGPLCRHRVEQHSLLSGALRSNPPLGLLRDPRAGLPAGGCPLSAGGEGLGRAAEASLAGQLQGRGGD